MGVDEDGWGSDEDLGCDEGWGCDEEGWGVMRVGRGV